MWGSQSFNQWALQPSMFQNVPHEEIDWAELAKQWIQMQRVPPPTDNVGSVPVTMPLPPPLPPPPPPPPMTPSEFPDENIPPPPPPILKQPLLEEPYNDVSSDVSRPAALLPETDQSYQMRSNDSNFWTNSEWELSAAHDIDERLWAVPPMETVAAPAIGKETFDYGHLPENPPLAVQTVDYNHVSDQFSFNQVYAPENQYDMYWSQVGTAPSIMPPTFLKKDRIGGTLQAEEDMSHLDAAKRKQLPAWIREGLEKMEQERLKRLEKERSDKEKAEKLKAKKILDMSSEKGLNSLHLEEHGKSLAMHLKSKFESDSEEEEEEIMIEADPVLEVKSVIPGSPVEDLRTEEEKHQELMLKVRRMLTEVLLDVTNSEILAISKEVYQKARAKAPARQLATSSALQSVATGLRGLASYGSHSDASSSEDEKNQSSDSDEELYRKIREKKKHFAVKEKKIIADLDRFEAEQRDLKIKNVVKEEPPKMDSLEDHHVKKLQFIMPVVETEGKNFANVTEDIFSADVKHEDSSKSLSLPSTPPSHSCAGLSPSTQLPQYPILNPLSPHNSQCALESDNSGRECIDGKGSISPKYEKLAKASDVNRLPPKNSSDSESGASSSKSDSSNGKNEKYMSKTDDTHSVNRMDPFLKKLYTQSKLRDDHDVTSEKGKIRKRQSRSKSSDSSSRYSKHSSGQKKRHRSRNKKTGKSSSHKKRESSSSSFSSHSGHIRTKNSVRHNCSEGKQHITERRRRSRSYSDDRRRKSRKNHSHSRERSRSRSRSFSSHRHSRSTSRGSYQSHYKSRHKESYKSEIDRSNSKRRKYHRSRSISSSSERYRMRKQAKRWSHSRSRSRTPRKYKRSSRSISTESEGFGKRQSIRYRNR